MAHVIQTRLGCIIQAAARVKQLHPLLLQFQPDANRGHLAARLPLLGQGKDGSALDAAATIVANAIREVDPDASIDVQGAVLRCTFSDAILTKAVDPLLALRHRPIDDYSPLPYQLHHAEPFSSKRILLEFSSPNIAKPFHVGHLRSTVIGNSLAHIHQACGHVVTRLNYLGDWGRQFGLVEHGFRHYGDLQALNSNPLDHLFSVYVQANQEAETDAQVLQQARDIAQEMETAILSKHGTNDPRLKLWSQLRATSIAAYEELYGKLGIRFDHYEGEAQQVAAAAQAVKAFANQPFVKHEANGALVAECDNVPAFVLAKGDGSSTYLTRDYTAVEHRLATYNPDELIYVAGGQQELHFKQLKALFAAQGRADIAQRLHHIGFGMVKGMSTRRGTVVFLDDLLTEVQEYMSTILSKNPHKNMTLDNGSTTTEQLALSAVVVQDLKSRRTKDYTFHWQRMLATEGDTGTFLQYSHARLASIERKAGDIDPALMTELQHRPVSIDNNPEKAALQRRLLFELAKFETSLLQASHANEPSLLLHQLFRIARASNSMHAKLHVIQQGRIHDAETLRLFQAARTTLATGLSLIGLVPLFHV
eukprot:TRINITY_DN9552_c0_g1_i1.p1 TRINITY_DN9552_c0_g1~~TRINITY_DN9552_c0_g1_i1.p1  ORF type:complete len:593 (+),score=138.43 TRINITY_DN9552_c0_g1_i1:79-1857(+)